jgi:hypothetical protein
MLVKLVGTQLARKCPAFFELESSLLCSHRPTIGLYIDPLGFNIIFPYLHRIYLDVF